MTGERTGGRTALVVMFAVYLVLLVWIVLWKVELPWLGEESRRVVKLVPFVAGAGTGVTGITGPGGGTWPRS